MSDARPDDDSQLSMTEIVRRSRERNAPRRARVLRASQRLGEIAEAKRQLELAEAKRRRFRFW